MVVIQHRIRVPDHFSTSFTMAELGILGDLIYHFSYSHRLISTTLGEMNDADNAMSQLYFGSDTT